MQELKPENKKLFGSGSESHKTARTKKEPESKPITLMIAASNRLVLEGVRKIVENENDMKVVAEATDYSELINLIDKKKPDILILHVKHYYVEPFKNDYFELLENIRSTCPESKTLLLLHDLDDEFKLKVVSLGVMGYLNPNADKLLYLRAIRGLNSGDYWIERKIIAKLLNNVLSSPVATKVCKPHLTNRELEIKELVILGCSNKEIARTLYISENTVKTHIKHIFEKYGVKSRFELSSKLVQPIHSTE